MALDSDRPGLSFCSAFAWMVGLFPMLLESLLSWKSCYCCLVVKSCPPLLSTPGSPILHHLGIRSNSCPLSWWWYLVISSPVVPFSFFAFRLSQHKSPLQWVGSSHQVAKVLEFQLHYQSFQWIFRVDFLRIDQPYFPAVQGTLKSLLQYHNSKASFSALTAIHNHRTRRA